MKVKIKTKSNFRLLNDKWLELVEVVGTRVTTRHSFAEFGTQTIDFTLSEVVEMDTTKDAEKNLGSIFDKALKQFM
jgi:hypothetical protein